VTVHAALSQFVTAFDVGVLLYLIAINSCYLFFTVIAFFKLLEHRRRWTPREVAGVMRSPATPPISVIVPAFNEVLTVVESVRSLLALHYPQFEVVVVNDGSTDGTLDELQRAFGLVAAPISHEQPVPTMPVTGVYRSVTGGEIVVVDKVNGGGKADAVNAGINAAQYPLVCVIDADSLLDEQALVRAVLPFIEHPETIAVGGIVRIANGCAVDGGRVVDARLPKAWLARFQAVEYLRAFLAGRVAHSALDTLLIISGGFGVFKRDLLLEVGGFSTDTVGEDMEIVTRLHRHCRERRRPYRITFLPDPICWTEAPESARGLAQQRNRWHRGTLEVIARHRVMACNARYGRVGILALPYYAVFEAFGPVVEGAGYVVTILGFCFGLINWELAQLMFLAAVLYGALISVGAVLLEEVTFRRYRRARDLLGLIAFGIIENFGYRQLTTWWRLRGWFDFLRNKGGWEPMPRKGFART
jgi:cellulose synthase/poly-beta-1,6-N-acetylglucosamine synthase-like glycosyltransferase